MSGYFSFKQHEDLGALFKVSASGMISFHHCPSGISQKGVVLLQPYTFG
jgi:hypothetical protein